MHNQSEIDAANRLLRELREVEAQVSHNDLYPVAATLDMPAANDDVALQGSQARA